MNAVIPRTSTAAVLSLVFGILCWFVLPFVGALVAVICGHTARSEIRRAPRGVIEGEGLATAGLILGWLHLALWVIGIVFVLLFVGGAVFLAGLASLLHGFHW